ncbi:MAG: UDP-N-acetylglucosamine--N-acetylmuramyl-(pentapeptide) pyrophosphoryl-undecaprenol N-acetylglucosamine transferase [Candidatus Peribacteraceae bacterium]|nr:UDP-N-acetylglucosamine--N-acetylmuramyl-(pentapeptide) pyrophosphoryl-undecaprenol N-acetylglucosamine transferase [Candidatus Peribacteraceae bacterium]
MSHHSAILFCGGGSLGHITPSLAVWEELKKIDPGLSVVFLCADRSDERAILESSGIPFRTIHAGKFPRGFSIRLLTFPALFICSIIESAIALRSIKPSVIFSKGGYVSVPVCLAAYLFRIPIVLHASDSVPNISDRLIGRIARTICTGFPTDTFPSALRKKAIQTGNPVRSMIASGLRAAGQRITGFSGKRPVLMIIGGSQGSLALNEAVDLQFDRLVALADIIHLTGTGKELQRTHARYWARPSVIEELPHLYALADLVVTRAGAGTLSELSLLGKAAIVVPLTGVAHDHQLKNAEIPAAAGAIDLLKEERLAVLTEHVQSLLTNHDRRRMTGDTLRKIFPFDAARRIAGILLDVL